MVSEYDKSVIYRIGKLLYLQLPAVQKGCEERRNEGVARTRGVHNLPLCYRPRTTSIVGNKAQLRALITQ